MKQEFSQNVMTVNWVLFVMNHPTSSCVVNQLLTRLEKALRNKPPLDLEAYLFFEQLDYHQFAVCSIG